MSDYARQFADNAATAQALTSTLTHDALHWRPAARRWSIAQCLDHLGATDAAYASVLQVAVHRARERGITGDAPFALGWFGAWFAAEMEPPPKRRFRAPKSWAPAQTVTAPPADPRPIFFDANGRLQTLAREAEGLDLQRIRTRSPLTPLLRFNVAAAFAIAAAHERRHLWQARGVHDAPGFPGTS